MAEMQLSTADFRPLEAAGVAQTIARPSLSYWQDAWIRLRANRRALFSLYLVIGLLAFTVAGPWLWRLDPNAQDLDQISQPPFADRRAMIVEPYAPWHGASAAGAPPASGLRLAEAATTQAVRLLWDSMDGAAGYRLYRNLFPIGEERAFGLPLFETAKADETRFEDRLDLRPRNYFYTVVALDDWGRLAGAHQTIEVQVDRVITLEEAEAKGLIPSGANLASRILDWLLELVGVEVSAPSGADLAPGDSLLLPLHPLGTDALGRDLLARLMAGARVSLFIGIAAPLLFVLFGACYGAVAGFFGGLTDQLLMRFADFVVALPFLLFMILIRVASGIQAGESGIAPLVIALVLLSWPATARLVRGQILQIREEGYIGASRLLGAKTGYLILRHMIPNTLGVILVTLTFAVPTAIFTEAFLSFIGMGVAPPTSSWGSMCNEGIKSMLTYPHELIFPALAISLTVLAFNLLGDGLRDALDVRMRGTE